MLDALRKLFGKKPPEPESGPEPEKAPEPYRPPAWRSDMIPQAEGPGEKVTYPGFSGGTTRIRWVSRETDESSQPVAVRIPEPTTRSAPLSDFRAAGRTYTAPRDMTREWFTEDGVDWCYDIYGRRVLCLKEKFPCFDSSDFLYEKRYFRWFFLYENGKLTRVQHTDERGVVTVTEDVRDVENRWLQELQKLDCFK